MIVEVLNIPWENEMTDLEAAVTRDAVYVIQKAVRLNNKYFLLLLQNSHSN